LREERRSNFRYVRSAFDPKRDIVERSVTFALCETVSSRSGRQVG
jgi:hypothetical protein